MKLVTAIIQPDKLDEVREELIKAEIYRITVSRCTGRGRAEETDLYRGQEVAPALISKIRLDEACIPAVASAGERPFGAGLTPFLTLLSPARKDQCDYGVASAGSVSNRGSSSSVGSAGGSGAPRASRPLGWLACRNKRLNSRSNLPVFHWPYRQVQSFCRRRKVWQSIYLRSSGASRFINKLRTYQCQSGRGFQIRRFRRMDLSPCGFYGMILVGGRAVFNRRFENISVRASSEIQREGRTEGCGLQYYLVN